jgi:hypothetical protein
MPTANIAIVAALSESSYLRTFEEGPELDLSFSLLVRQWHYLGDKQSRVTLATDDSPDIQPLPNVGPTAVVMKGIPTVSSYTRQNISLPSAGGARKRQEIRPQNVESIVLETPSLAVEIMYALDRVALLKAIRHEAKPAAFLGDLHVSLNPHPEAPELSTHCRIVAYRFLDLDVNSSTFGMYVGGPYETVVKSGGFHVDPDVVANAALAEIEVLNPLTQ